MNEIINAITQLFNILIFGTMNPDNNSLTIKFISIENFTISINAISTMITYTLIAITTTIMIYYLFDIAILLFKRFTK